jgi:transposase
MRDLRQGPRVHRSRDDRAIAFEPAVFFIEVHKREKLACDDCEKYEDHEPLTRQKKIFERLGVSIAVSTLADWVGGAANALEPIAALIRKLVLTSLVLQCDDTDLEVRDDKVRGGAKKGHL